MGALEDLLSGGVAAPGPAAAPSSAPMGELEALLADSAPSDQALPDDIGKDAGRIEINFDAEAERRKELARKRVAALMETGQKVEGKRAVTYAEANPEHSMLPGLLTPMTAGPTLAAMAYQGTLNPTINTSEAAAGATSAALAVAPSVAGVAAGTAAGAAAAPTGPGAIVVGGAAGGAASIGVEAMQTKALQALGLLAKKGEKPKVIDRLLGDEPAAAALGTYATQFGTFYPGGWPELAKVAERKLAGQAVTAAEKKALQAAVARAAVSGAVGTGVQVGASMLPGGQEMSGGDIFKSFVQNALSNQPGPLGQLGEAAGSWRPSVGASPTAEPGAGAAPETAPAPETAAPAAPEAAAAPEQPPLPDRWGGDPGRQVIHNFAIDYDSKKAIIDAAKPLEKVARPWQETAAEAKSIIDLTGHDPQVILGDIENFPNRVHALNVLLVQHATEAAQATKAVNADPSDANLLRMTRALAQLKETAAPADAARSAAGRGLNINKATIDARGLLKNLDLAEKAAQKIAQARTVAQKKAAQAEYKKTTAGLDREKLKDIAKLYATMPDGSKTEFASRALTMRQHSMIYEAWVNGLMGARTIMSNFFGNNALAAAETAAITLAAAPGKGRVTGRELAARGRAGVQALLPREAARAVNKATFERLVPELAGIETTGPLAWEVAKGSAKLEQDWLTGSAVAADRWSEGYLPAIPGKTGKVIRTVTRVMRATDAGFKAFHFLTELDSLAYREAARRGLSATEAGEFVHSVRVDSMAPKPTVMMRRGGQELPIVEAARSFMKRATLSEENAHAQALIRYGMENPAAGAVVNIMLPFKTTLFNIGKTAVRYSPLPLGRYIPQKMNSLLPESRQIRALILEGEVPGRYGWPEFKQFGEQSKARAQGSEEYRRALARMGLGTALATWVAYKAYNGDITGEGPTDPAQRATLYATGWMPNARKGKDRYYSYSRFDPFATVAGMAATWGEIARDQAAGRETIGNGLSRAAFAMARQLGGKPMGGLTSIVADAIFSPDNDTAGQRFEDIGKRLLASAVPATLNDVAQAMDPYLREDRDFLDTTKNKIPILREQQPPKRDRLTGKPITSTWAGSEEDSNPVMRGLSMLSTIQTNTIKDFPLAKEVAALNFAIGKPPDSLKAGGQTIRYTRDEYENFLMKSGQSFYEAGSELIANPAYQRASTSDKDAMLRKVLTASREKARHDLEQTTRLRALIRDAELKAKRAPR